MDAPGTALRPGTPLDDGRFEIDAVLGHGGFGITYRAMDTSLQRHVAIKEFFLAGSTRTGTAVSPPPHLEDEFAQRMDRIRDEARVLARFRHPGIVAVHEFFEENDSIYVVMDMLEGRSLLDLMNEWAGPLPEKTALGYATDVAKALDAVHEEHVLHRDIKPGNIIVTKGDQVVLVDFGTAHSFSPEQSSLMSQTLSPGYAPVEQYTAQGQFGPSTDVYALGATLYHMVTDRFPTPSLDRFAGRELMPPHEVNPAVSPHTSQAIMWAMNTESADRPQTAGEFLEALDEAAAAAEIDKATRIVTPLDQRVGASTPPRQAPQATARPAVGHAADQGGAPTAPSVPDERVRRVRRRRRRVRRGLRRTLRIVINLALTIAIGIAATFAVTLFLNRDSSNPEPGLDDTSVANGGTLAAPEFRVVGVAEGDQLTVRAGPGVAYLATGALAADQDGIRVTGNIAEVGPVFWFEILGEADSGWIDAGFVTSDDSTFEEALTQSLVATPIGDALSGPGEWPSVAVISARTGPGSSYPEVFELAADTSVSTTGNTALIDGELWVEAQGPDELGWVPASLLDVIS